MGIDAELMGCNAVRRLVPLLDTSRWRGVMSTLLMSCASTSS
jgi:hypothetical protein